MRLPHVLRQEQQRRRYLNQGRWRLRVAARHSPFLVLRRLLPLVYPHRCRLVAATGKIAQTGGEVDRCQCTATDFPIAASDTFPDVPEPYTKRLRLYRKLLAGGPSLHCIIPTEGAPSLRFLQGWVAMLAAQLLSVLHYPLCMPSSCPPFAKYAKDGAPAAVVASAF